METDVAGDEVRGDAGEHSWVFRGNGERRTENGVETDVAGAEAEEETDIAEGIGEETDITEGIGEETISQRG